MNDMPVFKTNKEAVIWMLFVRVLGIKVPGKIDLKKTLSDFTPKKHKDFSGDYVQMFIDRIGNVFNVPTGHLKNKNIGELLTYLEESKAKAIKFGNRPIKRSQYR